MADIELVIKIPESEIPKQQDIIEIPLHFIDGKVCEAGGYGFDVLPKGHGNLIDENELIDEIVCEEIDGSYYNVIYAHSIYDAEPIIEADKENKI